MICVLFVDRLWLLNSTKLALVLVDTATSVELDAELTNDELVSVDVAIPSAKIRK